MTDPSREIDIDAFGPIESFDSIEAAAEAAGPEHAQLIRDAAMGDPGEAGEEEVLRRYSPARSAAAVSAEQRALAEHEQMVMGVDPGKQTVLYEQTPEGTFHPRQVTPAPIPVAVIYPSRTGGQSPHIVTLALWHCTCEAAVLGNRDCWAITETKRIFGGSR